jgi:hypothetical protein
MLLVLIPIAWLTVIALCWTLCRMAQRGEAEALPSAGQGVPSTGGGQVAWEGLPELTVQDARLTAHGVR